MATVIKVKRNETVSTPPGAGDLEVGEIAINTADQKLFIKDSTNAIREIGGVTSVNSVTGAITAAHIATAVEAASDSNTFTDADHTKLNAIEASADVTDVANVTAAGALMDTELAGIAAVKATTGTFLTADQTKLDGIEALADVTDTTNVVAALTAGTNITIAGNGTIAAIATQYFPFYQSDGTQDNITLTTGEFPFYQSDGTQDNIGII